MRLVSWLPGLGGGAGGVACATTAPAAERRWCASGEKLAIAPGCVGSRRKTMRCRCSPATLGVVRGRGGMEEEDVKLRVGVGRRRGGAWGSLRGAHGASIPAARECGGGSPLTGSRVASPRPTTLCKSSGSSRPRPSAVKHADRPKTACSML